MTVSISRIGNVSIITCTSEDCIDYVDCVTQLDNSIREGNVIAVSYIFEESVIASIIKYVYRQGGCINDINFEG